MAKVAVLMAEGYEEGETLTIVDILRRAEIETATFSFGEEFVKGMHHMYIKADKVFITPHIFPAFLLAYFVRHLSFS